MRQNLETVLIPDSCENNLAVDLFENIMKIRELDMSYRNKMCEGAQVSY